MYYITRFVSPEKKNLSDLHAQTSQNTQAHIEYSAETNHGRYKVLLHQFMFLI
jgi:hypothetical protein